MYFEKVTAILCALGWVLHWLASWGTAWKVDKIHLFTFLFVSPPVLLFSIVATVTMYLMGPAALAAFDVVIPGDANTLKLLAALAVGYMGDSLVTRIAALLPSKQP